MLTLKLLLPVNVQFVTTEPPLQLITWSTVQR